MRKIEKLIARFHQLGDEEELYNELIKLNK